VYYALHIEMGEEAVELVQALLDTTGPMGLEIRDHTLKPPPGAPPLPHGKVALHAYYESDLEADDALRQVLREFPDASAHCAPVEQEDWAETWKKHVKPTRVGRLWVGPSWELPNAGEAPIHIVIDPGMAFGTGDHPTTSLCLGALDRALEMHPGSSVLDVGTGSGVLAIAARLLGAGKVLGNDIDPHAVRIARENAELNRAGDIDLTDKPGERIEGSYDIVVANRFANVLCQLAPRLAARTAADGVLLLSGVLSPQTHEVVEAFEAENMRLVDKQTSGEWVLLSFEHRTR